ARVFYVQAEACRQPVGLLGLQLTPVAHQVERHVAGGPHVRRDVDVVGLAERDLVDRTVPQGEHGACPAGRLQAHVDADDHPGELVDDHVQGRPANDASPVEARDRVHVEHGRVDVVAGAWAANLGQGSRQQRLERQVEATLLQTFELPDVE